MVLVVRHRRNVSQKGDPVLDGLCAVCADNVLYMATAFRHGPRYSLVVVS